MNAIAQVQERSLWRIYALEAKYEFLKVWRMPGYVIPNITFPLAFYLFFGVAMAKKAAGGFPLATYLLATYGTFGVLGSCLFGFGVGVAMERGQGWMLFKRATPMPPLAHLLGRLSTCLIFSTMVVGGLFTLGVTVAGVQIPPGDLALLFAVCVAGALPFGALGLAIGYWAGPNSAPAMVSLVYSPVAICSGLWFPYPILPGFLQKIGAVLPAYHLSQIGLKILGLGEKGYPVGHGIAYLAVFTVLALALAWAGYRRDEGRTFG